jgi:putative transposase
LIPHRVHNFGTYFITTQSFEHRSIFQNTALADLLIETLLHYRTDGKYLLHDFVIMPDHLHVVLTPVEITVERAVQFIKGGFSHSARQQGFGSLEIWQKGFTDHRIRDGNDYEVHVAYVRMNPVRAGLCAAPEQYVLSSASGPFALDEVPQRLKPELVGAGKRHG